ncbi:conserved protein of unknown function [Methylorubrum extorquens DM4]|uniref:DUF4258 domain-containing protein n=1 Tax=Methylorubrum extorquens (strain DSM 6343 / CIP 106787 / DM4) TaxID=661410 RepID=C7C7B4_METED|nr:hypothetical protein [Methylorubrum extorquens]CAX25023.1 conserved protein of unknown function [Methylorubrum extorquens DM4]
MIATPITTHARERLQQRAIPPLVIELLEDFGSPIRAGGAERLIFDKAARRRLTRHLGGPRSLRMIEPWLNVYAVVADDGCLVTASQQRRHHRR